MWLREGKIHYLFDNFNGMVPFDNKLWRVFSNWDWVFRAQKKLSKNYIFNCFFLISVKKGGAHKTKVLDSMLVFRCSPINSIEVSRLVYYSWIKMSETLGKESVKNGPNLSSSAQVLMGDTSLSEAKYNYFWIFTLFY